MRSPWFSVSGETSGVRICHKDAGPSWAFLGLGPSGQRLGPPFATVTDAASSLASPPEQHRDYIDWDLPEVSRYR
jgi:hypothetical protein